MVLATETVQKAAYRLGGMFTGLMRTCTREHWTGRMPDRRTSEHRTGKTPDGGTMKWKEQTHKNEN